MTTTRRESFPNVAAGRAVRVFSGEVRQPDKDRNMVTHTVTMIFVPTDDMYDDNTFYGPLHIHRLFVSWDGSETYEAMSPHVPGFTFTFSQMRLVVPGVCSLRFHSLDQCERTIKTGTTTRYETTLTRQDDFVLPETYVSLPTTE